MQPRYRIMLMSILTAALMSTNSFCGTVLEDFERYAVGGAAYTENGWMTVNAEGNQSALIASVDSAFSSDAQSLRYTDFDAGSLYDLRLQMPLSESLTNGMFCFDFRVDKPAQNPTVFLRDSSGGIGLQVNLMNVSTRTMKYHDGTGLVDLSGVSLSTGLWYRVEVDVADVSGSSDTFDIRVLEEDGGSGTEVISATGVAFRNDISNLALLEFASNAGSYQQGCDFYLDNVQFPVWTIPVGGSGLGYASLTEALNNAAPGDRILVHDGVYRESISLTKNNVSIVAAAGERPVIDGTEPVTSVWTRASTQFPTAPIYKTSFSGTTKQLFLDGDMMIPARWPNVSSVEALMSREGWAMVEEGSGPTDAAYTNGIAIDSDLVAVRDANGDSVDWDGAIAVINLYTQFFSYSRHIHYNTSQPDRFTYDSFPLAPPRYEPYFYDDYYYLTGVLGALDAAGEWFLDESEGVLYFWAPDGLAPDAGGRSVAYKDPDRAYAITSTADAELLTLDGLHFFGTSIDLSDSDASLVRNCHFLYPSVQQRQQGDPSYDETRAFIRLAGADSLFESSSIAYGSLGISLTLGASIENCLIHDIDWFGNLGNDPLVLNGRDVEQAGIVRTTTIFDTGAPALRSFRANNGVIELNHLYHAGMLSQDVSTLYCNGLIHGDEGWGLDVRYNWVHDGPGPHHNGIRADDDTSGVAIHHNLIWSEDRVGASSEAYWNWDGIIQNSGTEGLAWGGMTYNNTIIEPGPLPDTFSGYQVNNAIMVNQATSGAGRDDHICANNLLCHGANTTAWLARSLIRQSGGVYTNMPGLVFTNAKTGYVVADLENPWYLDFRPVAASLEDVGYQHLLLSTEHEGSGPDMGAYEADGSCWVPGHCNGLRVADIGSGIFSVSLAMPIVSPVRVELNISSGSVSPAVLDFSPANWSESQGITVSGSSAFEASVGNWGAAEVNLSQIDSATGLYVWFALPDLGLDLPLRISGYQPDVYVWQDLEDTLEGVSISNAVSGWYTVNETDDQYTATEVGNTSPFVNSGNMMALRYVDQDTNGIYNLQFGCDSLSISSSDSVKITFDYCCTKAGMNPTFFFNDAAGQKGIHISFDSAGTRKIQVHDGSQLIDVSDYEIKSDTWYRFELTVQSLSSAEDTFDLCLTDYNTGIVVCTNGLPFRNNVSDLDEIKFGTNTSPGGNGHESLYDNLRVVKINSSAPQLDQLLDPLFAPPNVAVQSDPVIWTNLVGVSYDDSTLTLTKTGTDGWTNSGACSAQWLCGSYGGVSFVVNSTNTTRFCGLSDEQNSNGNYNTIDYALVANASGNVLVCENGVWKGNYGSYESTDNFRVERAAQYVSYYHNEELIYISQNVCLETNQVVDCFIYNQDAELRSVRIWAEELRDTSLAE